MKIIFSRKGLDAGFEGAIPSPILPSGRMLSLPIPVTRQWRARGEVGIAYDDLMFEGRPVSAILAELGARLNVGQQAHLDPDLDRDRLESRDHNWRPVFGQTGASQGHLENQGIGADDLFLFFGRFRHSSCKNADEDLHVIFGWLQVGDICRVREQKPHDWLNYHPHVVNASLYEQNNTVYIAADRLKLAGLDSAGPGAGTFSHFKNSLQLTAPSQPVSHWRLPRWFHPYDDPARPALTYHDNPRRWTPEDGHVILRAVPRGQEFVFDTLDYPEANGWLKELFELCC